MKRDTSWGVETVIGHYQKTLILPNMLRWMEIKKGERVLDLGSGPGFFANEFARKGASVVGVELSKELVEESKKKYPALEFHAGSAEDLSFVKTATVDKMAAILAFQNMDNLHKVIKECARAIKAGGKLFIVMTHPAFRVLKKSEWGWDERNKIQYRRIDGYLSESKEKIAMHPSMGMGAAPEEYTISFHRPIQTYFKLLRNSGFAVTALEEWESNKVSEFGPRSKAEDAARKEIPLFLFLEATKQ